MHELQSTRGERQENNTASVPLCIVQTKMSLKKKLLRLFWTFCYSIQIARRIWGIHEVCNWNTCCFLILTTYIKIHCFLGQNIVCFLIKKIRSKTCKGQRLQHEMWSPIVLRLGRRDVCQHLILKRCAGSWRPIWYAFSQESFVKRWIYLRFFHQTQQ